MINNPNMKKVRAEDTLIWNRPEKNAIYLLSEFIDNSKSSYEEMIDNNQMGLMPIILEFNCKKQYIGIKDEAKGFDIQNSIEKIGRDEIQFGQTNQYYVGMKSAMNFFGDFTILISERLINGTNHRFANIFIYKNGIFPVDIELTAMGKTGSEIFMFSRYAKAYEFWSHLNFLNKADLEQFPDELDLKTESFVNYSQTRFILDNLRDVFPIISECLFQRYTPLVNNHPNIEITFLCFDSNGNDLLLDNSNRIKPHKGDLFPEFFKKIRQNNWENNSSFSFNKFFIDERNKFFKESLNSDIVFSKRDFRNGLEILLLNEVKKHFFKIKPQIEDELEKNSLGEYQPNFEWINYSKEAENLYLSEAEEWDKYPFARDLLKIFLNGFFKNDGCLSNIAFKISNLTIDESRKIIVSRTGSDENTFDVIFDFNVFSNNYNSKIEAEKFVTLNQELISGLSLIQNNRAIYHGPNFNQIRQVRLSNPLPEKMLVKTFSEGNPYVFPNYIVKRDEATFVKIGGNVARWSARLFGSIYVPNNAYFTSGTNKAQTSNLNILEEYILKVIRDSAINVITRWVHLIDNGAFFGKPTQKEIEEFNYLSNKDREKYSENGKILIQILADLYTDNLKDLSALNKKTGSLDLNILKEKLSNKVFHELEKAFNPNAANISQNLNLNNEENSVAGQELENKDEDGIMKYVLIFFKNIKKAPFNPLKLKKVESLEKGKQIILEFGGKTFGRWKNTFALHFKTGEELENDVEYILEDGEPIKVTIPLNVNQWNIKDLEVELQEELIKIYRCFANLQGFYKVATSKSTKKINLNFVEEDVEAYLANELEKLNLQGK